MTRYSRMRKSRDKWKRKAVVRGTELRENCKKFKRLKLRDEKRFSELENKISELESEKRSLQSAVNKLQSGNTLCPDEFMLTRIICLLLFIIGIVSFRAVPRILSVFSQSGIINISRIPHFTSVINWCVRAGIGLLQSVRDPRYEWMAVIDTSIDIGTRKALVVLRVSLSSFHQKQKALGLEDCECIGIRISNRWNGETVKSALAEIFADSTLPVGIIRDNGTDIKKGVNLFADAVGENPPVVIEDIGHAAANALKDEFAERPGFKRFLEIIRKGASRIRQTDLAGLRPPKLRTKGRFQSITGLSGWAVGILDIIGGRGKAKSNSKKGRLRKAFEGLCGLRSFLEKFISTCNVVADLQKMLKTEGLNSETHCRCKSILEKLPSGSRVRIRLTGWLDSHIHICRTLSLNGAGMPISSDVIESLFGKFKNVVQRCPQAELNRLIYVIPLLCGRHQPAEIEKLLHEVSHADMQKTTEKGMPATIRQMRRRTLKIEKKGVPKTGNTRLSKGG